MAFPDLAAECLIEEWDQPGRHCVIRDTLKRSRALFFLVDATKLAVGDRQEEFTALKALSYLCELDGHRRRGWPGRPVAILLTKTEQTPAAVANPEQFLADLAPQFWDLLGERLHRTKVFATSVAAGVASRDDHSQRNTVPLRIEPKGIAEAFRWIVG